MKRPSAMRCTGRQGSCSKRFYISLTGRQGKKKKKHETHTHGTRTHTHTHTLKEIDGNV